MRFRRLLLHGVAVLGFLSPSLALGASITIDDPAFASLDSAQVPNGHELAGQLPAFDASLGTLTSVSIRTIGVGSAFLVLDAPEAGLYLGPLSVSIALLDESHSVLGTASSLLGTIVGSADSAGPVLLQDGNAFVTTIHMATGLSAFLLSGSYTLEINFYGTVSGPGLAVAPYLADSFTGSIAVERVTYSYATPIPEPSTGLLLGLGLVGIAVRGKRASARRQRTI